MKKDQKIKRNTKPPGPTVGGRRVPRWGAGLLVLAVLAAIGFWWSKTHDTAATPVSPIPDETHATNQPAVAATSTADFQKLKGKWLRPDGGYVLEIISVEDSGLLNASYSNPRPIHVAKAAASRQDSTVKVFIELRDVNYPGSTYDLAYDPAKDQLNGIYYQAALQQRFEVVFERMK